MYRCSKNVILFAQCTVDNQCIVPRCFILQYLVNRSYIFRYEYLMMISWGIETCRIDQKYIYFEIKHLETIYSILLDWVLCTNKFLPFKSSSLNFIRIFRFIRLISIYVMAPKRRTVQTVYLLFVYYAVSCYFFILGPNILLNPSFSGTLGTLRYPRYPPGSLFFND